MDDGIKLTTKQEKFCIEVMKGKSYIDAYKASYNVSNMKDATIYVKASVMLKKDNIRIRMSELRNKVQKKELYTIEESIKRDLNLIRTYEASLEVLKDLDSDARSITAAERTIKYISASGYNSAQDRISKQSGFFEKDNKQKEVQIEAEITEKEAIRVKKILDKKY